MGAAPVAALALGLTATAVITMAVHEQEEARQDAVFRSEVDRLVARLDVRMAAYEQVLRDAQAYMASSSQVTRDEWHAYYEGIGIERSHPGLQGLGFAAVLLPEEVAAHEGAVREEGVAGYVVHPRGNDRVTAIVYLEPVDARNARALGFDMYSNDVRREAMERARVTREPALTGLVRLVQETDVDVQPGFLMYYPTFSGSLPSVPGRAEGDLLGWTYAPFRAHDFMQGLLPSHLRGLAFELYDQAPGPERLLYDTHPEASGGREVLLRYGGHEWVLQVQDLRGGGIAPIVWSTAAGGLVSSLLLAALVASIERTRGRAERRAEEMTKDLQASRERYRALSDSANDAILNADADGTVTYANPATHRIFGWRPEDLVGQSLTVLLPERLRGPQLESLHRLRQSGPTATGRTVELTAIRKDGAVVPVELSLSVWREGERVNFTGIARDVTERREAERRRVEATRAEHEARERELRLRQLEELARMRSQFLNVSAHELATPLTPLGLQVYLLEKADPESPLREHRHEIQVISRGLTRLRNLVRDILDSSRIESGRLRLDWQEADVAELVRQAVETFAASARNRQLDLRCEAPKALPATVDPDRVAQVLDNLLANALRFTPAGGSIRVRLRQDGDEAEVAVADTGPGLTSDQIGRLFQPFSQVHDPMQQTDKGSGLGLYISRAIVEAHGGMVWAESPGAGKGSTFSFRIPLHRPAAGIPPRMRTR